MNASHITFPMELLKVLDKMFLKLGKNKQAFLKR